MLILDPATPLNSFLLSSLYHRLSRVSRYSVTSSRTRDSLSSLLIHCYVSNWFFLSTCINILEKWWIVVTLVLVTALSLESILFFFLCFLIFCWNPNILCRTAEIEINCFHTLKWGMFPSVKPLAQGFELIALGGELSLVSRCFGNCQCFTGWTSNSSLRPYV